MQQQQQQVVMLPILIGLVMVSVIILVHITLLNVIGTEVIVVQVKIVWIRTNHRQPQDQYHAEKADPILSLLHTRLIRIHLLLPDHHRCPSRLSYVILRVHGIQN